MQGETQDHACAFSLERDVVPDPEPARPSIGHTAGGPPYHLEGAPSKPGLLGWGFFVIGH
jgi:hypothetical protein